MTKRQQEIIDAFKDIKNTSSELIPKQKKLNLPSTGEEVLEIMIYFEKVTDLALELVELYNNEKINFNKEQINIKIARAEGLLKGMTSAFEYVLYYHKIPEEAILTSMKNIHRVKDEILSILDESIDKLSKKE